MILILSFSISFRICPKELVAELEETVLDDGPITQSYCIETAPKQPSPFSFKHVVHGSGQSNRGVDNSSLPDG